MSKKGDKQKQLRLQDDVYRQLLVARGKFSVKVSISAIGNRAIEIGLPTLIKNNSGK